MADLTLEVALSHKAPHQTGYHPKKATKFDEAAHPRQSASDHGGEFVRSLGGQLIADSGATHPIQIEAAILQKAIETAALQVAKRRIKTDKTRHPLDPDGEFGKIRDIDLRKYMKHEIRDTLGDDVAPVMATQRHEAEAEHRDFLGTNGRVEIGFSRPTDPLLRPYTEDERHEHDVTMSRDIAQEALDLWASSSGDHKPDAIRMQRAVRDEFNLDGAEMGHLGNAENFSKEFQQRQRAFVRAEYNRTQAWFKEHGITHVTIYRGVGMGGGEGRMEKGMQPASSWTTDLDTAYDFASSHGQSKVLAVRVPVSQVLSTCVTGRGCLHEKEIILLGKPTIMDVYDATYIDVKNKIRQVLSVQH